MVMVFRVTPKAFSTSTATTSEIGMAARRDQRAPQVDQEEER